MYCFGRAPAQPITEALEVRELLGQAHIFSSFLRKGCRSYPSRGSTHQRMGVWKYARTSRLSAPLISPLLCVSACKTQSNRHFPGFIAITKGRISIRPYFVSLLETDYLITHFLLFCACKTSSRQPSKKTHFAIHHQHSIFVP